MTDFFDAKGIVFQPSSNGNYTGRDAKGIEFKFNPSSGGFDVTTYGAVGDGVTDDTTAIQNAINAANTAGGGIVLLGAKTYYIAGNLVPAEAVTLQGCGWSISSSYLLTGGTILLGSGANACLVYAPTTYSGQPTANQILTQRKTGFHVKDLAFKNFTYAVQSGRKFNTGLWFSSFSNLYAYNCSAWAFYFENCQLIDLEDIFVRNDAVATGCVYVGSSITAQNSGNFKMFHVLGWNSVALTRGVVFQAYNGGTHLNDINAYDLQVNQPTITGASYAATTIVGTTITLTGGASAGANLPIDMPVSVASAANGLVARQTYFVVSNDNAGNITISDKQGGTAKSMSGAGMTLICFGFPSIEIVGYGDSANNSIQPSNFTGLDCEGICTTNLLLQQCQADVQISYIFNAQVSNPASITANDQNCSAITVRSSTGIEIRSNQPVTIDMDSANAPTYFLGTSLYNDTAPASTVQASPLGIFYDRALGVHALNLSGNPPSGIIKSLHAQSAASRTFLYPSVPMGQRITNSSSTSLAMTALHSGAITYTGSGGTTWTLPALVAGVGGAATNNTGGMIFAINNGASAAVTLTVAANGTDKFNFAGSAKASYALTQGQSITVVAQYDGTNAFWQVIGINGAT